jgi:hypothetical protein
MTLSADEFLLGAAACADRPQATNQLRCPDHQRSALLPATHEPSYPTEVQRDFTHRVARGDSINAGRGADVHSGVFAGHHSNVHEYDRRACSGRFVEHCCTQQSVDLCRFRHNRDIKNIRSAGRTGCERERDFQSHFWASNLRRRSRRQCIVDESDQRQKASRDSG